MFPQLVILGYSEAAMFLRNTPLPRIAGIISIHGTDEFGVEAAVEHRLDLLFDDVGVIIPNDPISMQWSLSRQRLAQEYGLRETAPTRADAAAIVQFAQNLRGQGMDGLLLCHCAAGISRAPAAALICLAVWHGPGTEQQCVAEIFRLRPIALPHLGLVHFADDLLGRGGKLVAALQAHR